MASTRRGHGRIRRGYSAIFCRRFDYLSAKKKRCLLVSNLRLHTKKSLVYYYFNNILKAKVLDIIFNSWDNKYYNRSCKVVFSSIKDTIRVKKICSHVIDGVEVTVESYRGEEKHPKVFLRGEHKMLIRGLNEAYIVQKLLEDTFVRCGPYSGIHFLTEEPGELSGNVVVTFYEEEARQKAVDILTREYKWQAESFE